MHPHNKTQTNFHTLPKIESKEVRISQNTESILCYPCNSKNEAITKVSILYKQQKKLRIDLNLDNIEQITTNFGNNTDEVKKQLFNEGIAKSGYYIILLIQPVTLQQRCNLQNSLNSYINSRKNILQRTFEAVYESNNEMIQSINEFNQQYQQVYLEILQKNSYNYRIMLTFWLNGCGQYDQLENQSKIQLHNYKKILEKMFTTQITFLIETPEKTQIWKNLVRYNFLNNSEYEVSEIVYKESATIILTGLLKKINAVKDQILVNLNDFKCYEETYKIQNSRLFQNLQMLNTLLNQFRTDEQHFQIFNDEKQENTIQLRIICKPQQQKYLSYRIKSEFLDKLNMIQSSKKVAQLLNEYGLNQDEFQQKFQVCLTVNTKELIIIGTVPKLNLIAQMFQVYDSKTFTINNPVLLHYLKQIFSDTSLRQDFTYSLKFQENKGILSVQDSMFDSTLQQICFEILQAQNKFVSHQFRSCFLKKIKTQNDPIREMQVKNNVFANFVNKYSQNIQKAIKNIILTNDDVINLEFDCLINLGKKQQNIDNSLNQHLINLKGNRSHQKQIIDQDFTQENMKIYIETLFQNSNLSKVEKLAIQIFDLPESLIPHVLDIFLNHSNLQTIFISVPNLQTFIQYEEIINKQFLPTQNNRSVIWQWENDQNIFTDYDPSTNSIIEQIYQNFILTKQKQTQTLKLPFNAQPSTHQIDLDQEKFICNKTNQVKDIIIQNHDDGRIEYFIEQQPMQEDLQNYITQCLKDKPQEQVINVLLTQYEICIDENEMIQKNVETGFISQIKCVRRELTQELYMVSFSLNNIQNSFNFLDRYIGKVLKNRLLTLPILSNLQIKELIEFIQTKCWEVIGNIQSENQIRIKYLENDEQQILDFLNKHQIYLCD